MNIGLINAIGRGGGDATINSFYKRVIDDGGVIENKVLYEQIAKDYLLCVDSKSNIYAFVNEYLGYKIGQAGTYPLISKMYNFTGLGDFEQATTTKMPVLAKHEGQNYLMCNNAHTNATTLGQVTGDLDIQVLMELVPGQANKCIIAHTSSSKKTFRLTEINSTTRTFALYVCIDGTTEISGATSTPFTPTGTKYWFRATRNQTTGLISYFWSENNETTQQPTSWTALNTSSKAAGQLYQQPSTPIEIGSDTAGFAHNILGKIYRAKVYSDSTQVIDFNPNEMNPSVNMLSWTGAVCNNVWTVRLSPYSYKGGVCYRSAIQFDGVDDEMTANIAANEVISVIGTTKVNNIHFGSVLSATSTTHRLGHTGTAFGRSYDSFAISFNETKTYGYAQNALQWLYTNYISSYYTPTFNNADKLKYTHLKSKHNLSPSFFYKRTNVSNFVAKIANSQTTKIVTLGDSTSPLGVYFTRRMQALYGGTSVGWSNLSTNRYDDRITIACTGTWTHSTLETDNELWGISGISELGTTGATLTVTPASSVLFNKIRVWYAKNTTYGSFDVVCNGVTTSINSNESASLGYTDIDVPEGNYVVTINNISGNVRLYGISLIGSGHIGYALCRGGSMYSHWLNRPYVQQFLTLVAPDLVIIQLGFNEGNHPSAVIPNSNTLVSQINSACSAEIVFNTSGWRTYDGVTDAQALSDNAQLCWNNGYKPLCDSNSKVSAFNLNQAFTTWTEGLQFGLYDMIDFVHPTVIGTRVQGEQLLYSLSYKDNLQFIPLDLPNYNIYNIQDGENAYYQEPYNNWTGNLLFIDRMMGGFDATKWDLSNPNSNYAQYGSGQSLKLKMWENGTPTAINSEMLTSKTTFSGDFYALLNVAVTHRNRPRPMFGFYYSYNSDVIYFISSLGLTWNWYIRQGGTQKGYQSPSCEIGFPLKITRVSNVISIYAWINGAWVKQGNSIAATYTNPLKLFIGAQSIATLSANLGASDIIVADTDFSTLYPKYIN